jgi:hypothetical protein
MDRGLRLEAMGLKDEDWGPCYGDQFTHEQFAQAWRGNVACPTEAEIDSVEIPTPVPKSVTMRQACQALTIVGKLDDVNAALAAMQGLAGELARIEWEKSQVVERNRPLVLSMGAMLGMSTSDMDQLFIMAKGL